MLNNKIKHVSFSDTGKYQLYGHQTWAHNFNATYIIDLVIFKWDMHVLQMKADWAEVRDVG